MQINIKDLSVDSGTNRLTIDNWNIADNESWGVFSTEGDIGSALGCLLCDELDVTSGVVSKGEGKIAQVSLVEQQRLLEDEIAKDDTDFLDRIDKGSSVYSLIFDQCQNKELTEQLIEDLDLSHLASSGFRVLSTGETRRVMLARALATQPELLVLDNPFTGLDIAHRATLATYLTELAKTTQLLVTFNREEDMPDWVEHIALFNHGHLESVMGKSEWENHPVIAQIKSQSQQQSEEMLALIHRHQHDPYPHASSGPA